MKKMQKLLALLLAVLLIGSLFLTGCSSDDGAADSQDSGSNDGAATSDGDTSDGASDDAAASGTEASGDVIYDGEGTVYFAIPDSTISRWPKFDAPMIEKWLKVYAPNLSFEVLDAEGDAQKQLQQIEGAITSGCDFLVYAPAEELSAAGALQLLNEENIPFCALSHTPYGGDCQLMVTMPFPDIAELYLEYMEENILPAADGVVKIGCIWGATGSPFYNELSETYHATLDQWAEEGKVEIVFEADTNDWTAASSAPVAEQMLTQTGNDVDVVISMNDDLLTGIVSVLEEQDLIGEVVLLGGCDSTVEGLARVQEGWQAADVLPDYDTQAKTVAEICATWLRDGKCPSDMADRTFDNNSENGLPQVLIPALLITQDNLKAEIVDAGVATQEAIDEVAKTLQ